jgi:hypothetical protein
MASGGALVHPLHDCVRHDRQKRIATAAQVAQQWSAATATARVLLELLRLRRLELAGQQAVETQA